MITYVRPDVYDYTLDDGGGGIYHIRIIAMNDGHGSLIITREGEEGKTELVIQEELQPQPGEEGPGESGSGDPDTSADTDRQGTSPATGDGIYPGLIMLWMLAALGIGMAAVIRGRGREEEIK